jgi:hypothetical protein
MRTILSVTLLLSAAMSVAHAGPALILNPIDGVISGSPGETVGWGFDLTADPDNWTTIIGTIPLFESNPGMGMFTDFMSPQGGPVGGALPANTPDWIQTFDANAFTGFGGYTIDPLAAIGDSDIGMFLVQYEQFSDDPTTCGQCFLASGEFFVDFTVNTVSPAPEPASSVTMLGGAGLVALAALIKRRIETVME